MHYQSKQRAEMIEKAYRTIKKALQEKGYLKSYQLKPLVLSLGVNPLTAKSYIDTLVAQGKIIYGEYPDVYGYVYYLPENKPEDKTDD